MTLTPAEIKELLSILEQSGWDEAQITVGDVTLTVSKGGGLSLGNGVAGAPPSAVPPAPAPAPAAAAEAAPTSSASPGPPAHGRVVIAPSVGVFWRAPEPGAAPFVDVGDSVQSGDTLCIVEVMKLMNHVQADLSGVITAIHAANGDHVEYGTPLFTLEPAG